MVVSLVVREDVSVVAVVDGDVDRVEVKVEVTDVNGVVVIVVTGVVDPVVVAVEVTRSQTPLALMQMRLQHCRLCEHCMPPAKHVPGAGSGMRHLRSPIPLSTHCSWSPQQGIRSHRSRGLLAHAGLGGNVYPS